MATLVVSDTVSEVSTRGSSMYSDSREDLHDLALVLGLPDVDHLCQERFRVDRRKLEQLLLSDATTQESAGAFFKQIMDETSTVIIWPARLKIGSKSKNDPYVRIAGRPDDVKEAKAKVMASLDVRSTRVTMKLNVSYTDHSHIIGKGGLTIKRVMEDTGCHIHFPDSNRSNPTEKSNQVSIAGDLDGVEKARAQVRELTPLMFSFELPIVGSLQPLPDPENPFLQAIQRKYNVQVMFRTRPKLHATLVVVKGCQWEVAQVKEATLMLMHHMCDSLADQVPVHMSIEISPQHHPIVLGKNSENLKLIMRHTATQIMFPDATDPNIPSIKKSYVLISGVIHNVYLARQQLLGALPLVVMFDVPEESISIDTEQLNSLMESLDVLINVRHKAKQNSVSIVIKGIERNASNIYEARKQLLNLNDPPVIADIPAAYEVDGSSLYDYKSSATKGDLNHFNLLNNASNMYPMLHSGIPSSLQSPSISSPLFNVPWGQFGGGYSNPNDSPSLTQQLSQLLRSQHTAQQNLSNQHLLQQLIPRMQHTALSHSSSNITRTSDSGCGSCCSSSLGYHSRTSSRLSGSSQSLDCRDLPGYSSLSSNPGSCVSSPAPSPRLSSPPQGSPEQPRIDLLALMSDKPEKKVKDTEPSKLIPTVDYQQKKSLAAKAMLMKPNPEILRVPSATWSGFGFSRSSPTAILKQLKKESKIPEPLDLEPWTPDSIAPIAALSSTTFPFGPELAVSSKDNHTEEDISLSISNYLDSIPSSSIASISASRASDLTSLLISIKMEKYIGIFNENEIDLQVFLSMTGKDLKEIGVQTFGARRAMLLAIAQHRQSSPFRGSAAPGAERRGSSSTNGTSSPSEFW